MHGLASAVLDSNKNSCQAGTKRALLRGPQSIVALTLPNDEGTHRVTQTLLVFSHLRWDFVFQRPQHLMTRLARHWRIIFIEEPVYDATGPSLEISEPTANVCVCRPHTPIRSPGFHDDQIPLLRELLRELLRTEKLDAYGAWFYTPMALPLLNELQPDVIVYDCMDELAAFFNAPRQLLQRENALLKMANVVFTGGPSLYEAKRDRHPAVYCFPSSVDRGHFARALFEPEHASQRALPRPRLGFYGVIDERLDLKLVAALAAVHPEWQIEMVGPVAKVKPADLPRAANIHYPGQQRYEDLPAFLAGWDVCLMPFELNAATRFISPTKVLEYMAAERPIVSTPIADVVKPYGDIVYIARKHDEFVAACERALASDAGERASRAAAMREAVARTSWDRTVGEMHRIVTQARGAKLQAQVTPLLTHEARPASDIRVDMAREYSVVVIGAGPTGLSAAYHLGENSLLLDQNDSVGGWCRSITDRGFTFDYAGHIMFSNDPYVHELYRLFLGHNVHWQDREAWIYSKRVYTRYPFQGALHGLPPDVLKECLIGAIEARFGPLKGAAATSAAAKPARLGSSPSAAKAESITDCCADGLMEAEAPLAAVARAATTGDVPPRNFEEFIYMVWGAGVA
jgi:UDP-galactopyranose mutase